MAFNIKQNSDGSAEVIAQGGGSELKELKVTFASGVDFELGRGTTDTDITYIKLRNADGTAAYIYPNATPDGVTVSTSRP